MTLLFSFGSLCNTYRSFRPDATASMLKLSFRAPNKIYIFFNGKYVCVCVCVWERENVCVCVCEFSFYCGDFLLERDREREKEF